MDDINEERFYTFGGVVRECLVQEDSIVERKKRVSHREIGQLSDTTELQNLIKGVGKPDVSIVFSITNLERTLCGY
ncbi:hypothetical protein L917_18761 [Phytophthora nicotianae]|uniref:Uncharacterized protein n=1 Tax=Phytophthora nicotianae TaxID=4792 RepID=W2K6N5_PHYNI|nr:hypothetical protein L917_18761 [Phytophthora nicotianae]